VGKNSLVGSWKLLSFEIRCADGTVRYPLGEDAVGLLIYTDDGSMSVNIMKGKRPHCTSDDIGRRTAEEKVACAESCLSYCGRYEVRGDRVVHHTEVSLFPNWVGLSQERMARLVEETLLLSTDPYLFHGTECSSHLVWTRL